MAPWIFLLAFLKLLEILLMVIPTTGPTTKKINDNCQLCQNIKHNKPTTVAPSLIKATNAELAVELTCEASYVILAIINIDDLIQKLSDVADIFNPYTESIDAALNITTVTDKNNMILDSADLPHVVMKKMENK